MNWFFSSSKPKKPQIKEDPMSEVDQTLAAFDSFCKKASLEAADLVFRVVRSPELADRVTLEEASLLVTTAFNMLESFKNQTRGTVNAIRQRGN